MRSTVARLAEGGRSPPSRATRSPARSSSEASARVSTSARSRLRGKPGAECQSMEALASRQNQTLWAAAHSVSRRKSRSDFADWRQSMRVAGSPG